jgi:hypothetical protein
VLAGCTLAPADQAFGADLGQEDSALSGNAEAGFKGTHKGEMKFAKDDSVDSHKKRVPLTMSNECEAVSSKFE